MTKMARNQLQLRINSIRPSAADIQGIARVTVYSCTVSRRSGQICSANASPRTAMPVADNQIGRIWQLSRI